MVSIQISLNGHSFYDTKQSKVWQSSTAAIDQTLKEQVNKLRKLSNSVHIIIATDNFVMIPADLYLPQDTEQYFTSKLLPYNTQEFQYIETRTDNTVLTVALETDLATLFLTTFTTLTFTHPLQQTLPNTNTIFANIIRIYQTNERCAISVVSQSKLIFSDYLKIASELDIVYYIKKLITDNNLNNTSIHCLGINRKHITESLSPYFKNISYTK